MIVDLTYPISEGMFKYPSDDELEMRIKKAKLERVEKTLYEETGQGSGAGYVEEKYISGHIVLKMRNHHGTHIDAPSHKIQGGKNIDEYGIQKFVNNSCILVDLTSVDLLKRKDREISVDDIEGVFDSEKHCGLESLIFYTGFCDELKKMDGKLKGDAKKDFEKGFPHFSFEAAMHVVEKNPDLEIIGIDSFSVDRSGSNSEVHRIFFKRDILPLENVVNLGELKNRLNKSDKNTFRLFSVPLNYRGSDAAQVRAYAFLDDYERV